jgi:hypothetical protein
VIPIALLESISFAQPWILGALLLLPVIWILLRLTPPSPKRLPFPAFALIFGLAAREETPARTPWWLILLRLLALALIIIGLAQPLLHSRARLLEGGDLILVIDDGWAAANQWQARVLRAEAILTQAARNDQSVALLTTARDNRDSPPEIQGLMRAERALALVKGLQPKAWPVDHGGALAALDALRKDGRAAVATAQVVWLSDGLGQPQTAEFARTLRSFGRVKLIRDAPDRAALLIHPPANDGEGMAVRLSRAYKEKPLGTALLAVAENGSTLARAEGVFAQGEATTELRIELPAEIRNRIARLVLAGRNDVGSSFLIDERWRRRPVGLVTGVTSDLDQPLLSEIYYVDRALAPFSELRKGTVANLLARDLAVLILPDSTLLNPSDARRIADWVEEGGLLIRFAGPRMAEPGLPAQGFSFSEDMLLPVRLRRGGRILDGALSWDEALRLAPFESGGVFAGLEVPADVQVKRQVLAEPSLELPERTLARLEDGTPLVTGAPSGRGQIVLFHVGANGDWSNLPLSGLFVEMLRRLVGTSRGLTGIGQPDQALPPRKLLDAFGVLGRPHAGAVALEAGRVNEEVPGPRHPPGLYGSDSGQIAFNLGGRVERIAPLPGLTRNFDREIYAGDAKRELDFKPWLLLGAILLLFADFLVSLVLRGHLRLGRAGALAVLLAAGAGVAPLWVPDARAQENYGPMTFSGPDARILEATLVTRLAYVLTDNPRIDEKSRAGLIGLNWVLNNRSSIEAGVPIAVDPEIDELIFYPLVYWPLTADDPGISQAAAARINHYLGSGGTIFFDLQDPTATTRLPGQGGKRDAVLAELARQLDIPPLDPVPPDHVLTKSFYLISDFPGRYAGAPLWIETGTRRNADGVATVIVGSNDWAAAWAVDESGRPLFPVVPGGERQREMAYRFGVNLAMYAMTGNYKADQVHIPFILERLGQ